MDASIPDTTPTGPGPLAIRLLGWLACAGVAALPFSIKGGSGVGLYASAVGAVVATLGCGVFVIAERIGRPGLDAVALRPIFAGYILGVRLVLAVTAFVMVMGLVAR